MFKSIRWKITLIFVLLVLATELLIGGFNILGIVNHYHRDFAESIDKVFTTDVKNDLLAAANEISIPVSEGENGASVVIEESSQNNINMINDILSSRSGSLGITASRFYCILDGTTGEVLKSSDGTTNIDTTPSVLDAIEGKEGKETGIAKSYMDYAFPLLNGDNVKYIVYIKDNCSTQNSVTKSLTHILMLSLLLSIVIAAIV